MSITILPVLAASAAMIAALFIAAVSTMTSAQLFDRDQISDTPDDSANRLQMIANETAFRHMGISQTWSALTIVPPGASEEISVSCEGGSIPTGGSFSLGASDLQILSSHAFADQNDTGWIATVYNSNASDSLPAIVGVLCLQADDTTSDRMPEGVAPVVPDAPEPDQDADLTVTTDSESYSDGDTITITGTVADREAGSEVMIEIVNSEGERDWLAFAPVFADNTYRLTIEAGEPENEFSDDEIGTVGTYLVTATYPTPSGEFPKADTTFEYEG